MIGTPQRRQAVRFFRDRKMSARRASWWLNVSRNWLGYASRRTDEDLVDRLKELAAAHPRFGVRRLHALLRREGRVVNVKRVRRVCKLHGLLLKQKKRRQRRGTGRKLPCRSMYPNEVWCYDFVEDRTETGRKLRILTVVDEYTRECIGIEVEHRMNSKFVAKTLLRLFEVRGTPKYIRSDNGSEFIAKSLMRVLSMHGVEARHIDPGSPWQNGLNERFNGTLRDECLNLETFHGRDHARALMRLFAKFYNEERPHSALGYRTPNEFVEQGQAVNGVNIQEQSVGIGMFSRPLQVSQAGSL